MSINLTDEIEVKTKKGKLGAAKQIFLEGDTQTVENEIQDINSRHNDLNSKHESLSSTVSEHTNQIESNQNQITANKSTQDAKNASLDANMAKLNTRDDQITDLVRGITATGGASVATTVTYDNTSSHLASATVQGAIDELQGSKIDKTSILQELGNAEDKVMSQKAVSDTINKLKNAGYLYAGIATPTTNPGTPEVPVFYIANGKGTYTNFGGLEVTEDDVVVLYWDSSWHKVSTGIASQDKLSELEKETNVLSELKECFNIIDNPNLFDGVTNFETSNIGSAIVNLHDCTLHYSNGNSNAIIAIPLSTEIGKEYKLSFKSDFVITGQNTYATIAEYIWASSGTFATVDTNDNNNNHVTFVARSTTTYFVIGVAYTIKEYTISELSCYRTDVEYATIKFEKLDNKPYTKEEANTIFSKKEDKTIKIKARNLLGHGVIYEGKIVGTDGMLSTNEYYNTIELDLTGIEGSLWGNYREYLDSMYVRDYIVRVAFKVGESWQYIENDDWNKPIKAENQTQGFMQIPSGCTIARVSYMSDNHITAYDKIISGTWLAQSRTDYMSYEPIKEKTEYPIKSERWYNKTMLAFGDSITAINNGNSNCIGYARFICDYFGIDKYYGRGIGSSCVAWHESPIWFSSEDGQYLGREESERPSGTEGVDYWSHSYADDKPSSFCSWDRIKTMIPDSIKDDVDLIFVMGGTNDHMSNKPLGEGIPTWSPSNVQDTIWSADTAYNGGDFDLSTFKGGLASTLMKIQKRCPNAVILFGTLIGGYNSVNNPKANGLGLTPRQYADASIEVCKMLSIPYVDVFTLAGINNFNNDVYLPIDKVHPYCKDGGKALASAIITGMENCPIKVDW